MPRAAVVARRLSATIRPCVWALQDVDTTRMKADSMVVFVIGSGKRIGAPTLPRIHVATVSGGLPEDRARRTGIGLGPPPETQKTGKPVGHKSSTKRCALSLPANCLSKMSACYDYRQEKSTFHDLDTRDNRPLIGQVDTGGGSSNRMSHFSQLVMLVPPETNAYCLAILWNLKEKGMVLTWQWEDGVLQVWADTDRIVRKASIPEGVSNAWLLRLIEATQCHDYCLSQDAEDSGTDFSFLGSSLHQTILQLA